MNHHKVIFICGIKTIILCIKLIGFEEPIIFTACKGLRPVEDVKSINSDDNCANGHPEEGELVDVHGILNIIY